MKPPSQCQKCGRALTPFGICPICSVKSIKTPSPKVNRFGAYVLVNAPQKGGMGAVYKAFSPGTGRHVALKVLKNEILLSDEAVERFRTEVRALAALDHRNILPIYEAGSVEGQPYFAMRWVEGGSLADRLAEYSLPDLKSAKPESIKAAARNIAKLISDVSLAVQHAHARNILHRDLKPANILLDAEGRPFVADFGIAKFLNGEMSSMTQVDIGSPPYMPPEPARLASAAWDVWSLGVILYELLSGHLPFQAQDSASLLEKIRKDEPPPLDAIRAAGAKDLAIICLKCLRKDPRQRYASAQQLSDDLLRFINGEPIQARPATVFERAFALTKRHPRIALLILGFLGVSIALGIIQGQVRQRRTEASMASLRHGIELLKKDQLPEGLAWLAKASREDPANTTAMVRAGNALILGNFLHPVATGMAHERRINNMIFSPDGKRLAVGSAGLISRVWDAHTGRPLSPPLMHNRFVTSLEFAPDGKSLVTGSADHFIRFWDANSNWVSALAIKQSDDLKLTYFTEGGRRLISVTADGLVQSWDVQSGRPIGRPVEVHAPVFAAECTTDGRSVLTISENGDIDRVNEEKLMSSTQLASEQNQPVWAGFSQDGRYGAMILADGTALIHDITERSNVFRFTQPYALMGEFSAQGSRLAIGSSDGTIHIIDVAKGTIRTNSSSRTPVTSLKFSENGKWLACGFQGGTLRVLDSFTARDFAAPVHHPADICFLAVHDPSGACAAGLEDGQVFIWSLRMGKAQVFTGPEPVSAFAVGPNGKNLVAGCYSGMLIARSLQQSNELIFEGHRDLVSDATFDSEGKRFATASFDRTACVWSVETNRPSLLMTVAHPDTVRKVALNPRMPILATACYDNIARLWQIGSNVPYATLPHNGKVRTLAFSPDGEMIATGSEDKTAKVWESRKGSLISVLSTDGTVREVTFSPDGKWLAAASDDNLARVWRLSKGAEPWREFPHKDKVMAVAFDPQGKRLLTASLDGTAVVWDLGSNREIARLAHPAPVWSASFSPNGAWIVTASDDNAAMVWDSLTGIPLTPPLRSGDSISQARFSPDGSHVITASSDRTIRLWPLFKSTQTQVPHWWPQFLEALAGKHVTSSGTMSDTPVLPIETWRSNFRDIDVPNSLWL